MKSNLLFGSILAAALSVGVGAQAPTGAPQDPTSPSQAQAVTRPCRKSSSDAITVTGCVQADSAAATGTSGSATSPAGGAAAAKSESFILANASAGSGGAAAAGTAGTTGAGATASQVQADRASPTISRST